MEHKSDDCTNCDWCFWHNNERIIKKPGGLGSWRTDRDYQNDSITEKSPGDLRRLGLTQTPVKNHQLTLMWKNSKGVNNNTHKLLWDFDIQTDHRISARRPDLIIINKKKKKKKRKREIAKLTTLLSQLTTE